MNYLIDIGNTSCKVAQVDECGQIGAVCRLRDESEVLAEVSEGADRIVLSTVRADNLEFKKRLKEKCQGLIDLDVPYVKELVTRRSDVRCLDVLKDMPEGMGADRIAAILAAHYLFRSKDLLVFDFGTAITVEFIDCAKDGMRARYLGGAISVGLMTRYRALNHFTGKIPLCDPSLFQGKPVQCVGMDLDTALAAGNILGIKFEIEGYMAANENRTVLLTGGDAFYFAGRLNAPVFVINNLVLRGLALILQYDEENK